MIGFKNQILTAAVLATALFAASLASTPARADNLVAGSANQGAAAEDCFPFGLAHDDLVTVFSCGLEFEPVSWPSPSEVFDHNSNGFTQCDGHVDGRQYWRTNADIYLTDNYTGIQWMVPAGTIADGASFPQPLRSLWTDRWSGLKGHDPDNAVPFALVAGFFHDFYMCRILRAKDGATDFSESSIQLKPYETPGCVHQLFEHSLIGFYNTPVIARISFGTVGLVGWLRGAGRPEPCRYQMASDGRPRVFWHSGERRYPTDIKRLAKRTWQWSSTSGRASLASTENAINSLSQWSAQQADALARKFYR